MRLKDKVAIVTGAASGIGKEIDVICAREGAKVAIADLDQKAADAAALDRTSPEPFQHLKAKSWRTKVVRYAYPG